MLSTYLFWRRQWHPTPVLLPGKSHGWRSLGGYSPWGCKESDMMEQLHYPSEFITNSTSETETDIVCFLLKEHSVVSLISFV